MLVPALSAIARSICATTVARAIPVVNAKARAKTRVIFFMIMSPSPAILYLPEHAKANCDRRHGLELFDRH
jgi:hypothetical protein